MLLARSPQMTESLGELSARVLAPGDVVALRGDLGSGKTTFVRGMARALGVRGPVGSPTYALCARHQGSAGRILDHFDAYFGAKERAFLLEGGAECLGGEGISVVEWPERIEEMLPADRVEIRFSDGSRETERTLEIEGTGPRGEELAESIVSAAASKFGDRVFLAFHEFSGSNEGASA